MNSGNWKRLGHFLQPSMGGLLGYATIGAAAVCAYSADTIRNFLQLPDNLNVGSIMLQSINNLLVRILGDTGTNDIVLAMFWGLVGLAVYVMASDAVALIRDLSQAIKTRGYIHPNGRSRNELLLEFLKNFALRTAGFAGLIIYVVYATGHVTQTHMSTLDRWLAAHSLVHIVYIFALSGILWHGLVLLMRLLVLRPRLFG